MLSDVSSELLVSLAAAGNEGGGTYKEGRLTCRPDFVWVAVGATSDSSLLESPARMTLSSSLSLLRRRFLFLVPFVILFLLREPPVVGLLDLEIELAVDKGLAFETVVRGCNSGKDATAGGGGGGGGANTGPLDDTSGIPSVGAVGGTGDGLGAILIRPPGGSTGDLRVAILGEAAGGGTGDGLGVILFGPRGRSTGDPRVIVLEEAAGDTPLFAYVNGAVGNSMIIEEALIVPVRGPFKLFPTNRFPVGGFQPMDLLPCLCSVPFRLPLTRASNSVVAAERGGISTLLDGVLEDRVVFDEENAEDESAIGWSEGADECVPEVVVVVVRRNAWVGGAVSTDAREAEPPFCCDISPRICPVEHTHAATARCSLMSPRYVSMLPRVKQEKAIMNGSRFIYYHVIARNSSPRPWKAPTDCIRCQPIFCDAMPAISPAIRSF